MREKKYNLCHALMFFHKKIKYSRLIQNSDLFLTYFVTLFMVSFLLFLPVFSGGQPRLLTAEETWIDDHIEVLLLDSPPHPKDGISGGMVSSMKREQLLDGGDENSVLLSDVPTSKWTYGCTATAAGMLFGYYDRIGYSNMYTGPANDGICPLTDLGQATPSHSDYPKPGSCYIIATEQGLDGITAKAHVDDYWISQGSGGPDPWKGNWEEHTWMNCTADFLGTNQWIYDTNNDGTADALSDGATLIYLPSEGIGSRLYDFIPTNYMVSGATPTACCHGLRLFAESRGYEVVWNDSAPNPSGSSGAYEVYSQRTDNQYANGFSFVDFQCEIDNGRPVLVHVEGHSMLGVGYNLSSEEIYIHNTWDNNLNRMSWGGTYDGRTLFAVTVLHLKSLEDPIIPLLSWYPNARIPSDLVTMNVSDGMSSYFDIILSNVSSGYHVTNGKYPGWCFEKNVQMTRQKDHPVKMSHSYDPDMNDVFKNVDWSIINYVINQNQSYNKTIIQDAIWNITCKEPVEHDGARSIVENATRFGSSFTPDSGDYIAVLLDPTDGSSYPMQNSFIQVRLNYTGCNADFWNETHTAWPDDFNPDDKVGYYFDLPVFVDDLENKNLSNILSESYEITTVFGNLCYGNLLKQAIAGILNTNHENISYPITYDQLIVSIHNVLSYPTLSLFLGILLEEYNQIGCDCETNLHCPCCFF